MPHLRERKGAQRSIAAHLLQVWSCSVYAQHRDGHSAEDSGLPEMGGETMTDRRGFLWASAICIAAGLACAGSCAAYGASLTCPPSTGPFGSSALSPDGRHLVCLADAAVPGKYELYGVDGIRDPWRLSPGMADDRDVIRFAISPDSQRVAFTSDKGTWTKYDLFTVGITGGSAVQINSPLPVEHDVDQFAWSPSRVVYVQGRNTTGWWELFSSPATGNGQTKLAPWSTVQRGFTVGGELVRFQADATGLGAMKWYAVPASGGRVMEEIMREDFERGTRGGFQ